MRAVSKVGFVVNPKGGGGASLRAWSMIESAVSGVAPYFTERPEGGTDAAKRAIADNCDRVVAVGGDGTVNEVANALIGTEVALGVVPVGTGNDYARTLHLPSDPVEAAKTAIEGATRRVDVGRVEGKKDFVNIAGVGFDAEVMTRFNSPGPITRALPVKARYYLSILRTFASYRGTRARLTLDGQVRTVDNLLLLAVGCAEYYGAGMHILPDADLQDGLFDLAWGQDVRLKDLSKLMGLIYHGKHVGHANVRMARAKRVEVSCEPATKFHLDGDVLGATSVTFECIPAALSVVGGK